MPPTEQERITFSSAIKSIALEKQVSTWEALQIHCEEIDMEESVAATLIHPALKAEIEMEVMDLNLLRGQKVVPLPF